MLCPFTMCCWCVPCPCDCGRRYRRVQGAREDHADFTGNPNTFVDDIWEGSHEIVQFTFRANRYVCSHKPKEPARKEVVEAIRVANCTWWCWLLPNLAHPREEWHRENPGQPWSDVQ